MFSIGGIMSKGIFISLEGPDGAGKTTQIGYIREYFEAKGKEVLITREPGGTAISEKLREILLDKANMEMADTTEMLIYAAARAQLVAQVIKPALDQGKIVISDRFVDSSIAYQGFGRDLGDQVRIVNLSATAGLEPDLTIFIDIDPEKGRARIGKESLDRMEQEKADFHRKVYEGYKQICESCPTRIMVIDGDRTKEEVRDNITDILDTFFGGLLGSDSSK